MPNLQFLALMVERYKQRKGEIIYNTYNIRLQYADIYNIR